QATMSPTTSMPVFRISVAIGVTSQSSTSNHCWISRQCGEPTPRVPASRAWHRHAVRGNVLLARAGSAGLEGRTEHIRGSSQRGGGNGGVRGGGVGGSRG